MDKIEVSVDYLSKLAGMPKEDFLAKIQTEEGELKENYEATVSDSIKSKIIEIREAQRNRGFKEGRKEIEGWLKGQGIEEYDDLNEALDTLQSKIKPPKGEQSKGGSKDLTLEEIQALPQVQDWFSSEVKALQAKKAQLETQLTEAQKQFHSYKVANVATSKAHEALQEAKAANLNPQAVDLYLRALGTNNLDIAQDGKITVLDNEGQPLKDEYHNPIDFKDYVVKNWAFGFSEVPAGSGSPNHKPSGKGGGSRIVFRDENHFQEEVSKAGGDNKRIAELTNAYAEQLESK